MTQLALFSEPSITGRCPDCGRRLRWIYTPAGPPPEPWGEPGADWSHGAEWAMCDCSRETPRAVRPVQAADVGMGGAA